MKKKSAAILILLLFAVVTAFSFSGCAPVAAMEPDLGVDLARKAKRVDEEGVCTFVMELRGESDFNMIVLREVTDNVEAFRIQVFNAEENGFVTVYESDRIGRYNLCYTETQTTGKVRFEVTKSKGKVSLKSFEIYNVSKKVRSDFKVTQYFTMPEDGMSDIYSDYKNGETGFSDYYDPVTDVILIGMLGLDAEGDILFYGSKDKEAVFADNLLKLKEITAGKNVNVWACMFLYSNGSLDSTARFIEDKAQKIHGNLKAFTEKYHIYGIDYDWEYPETSYQWRAYSGLILDTAEYTRVSAAAAPWGFNISKKALYSLEHVNLMAYDIFDSRGHHSTMYDAGMKAISDAVQKLKIPREKVLLGIPFYGRAVNGSGKCWPNFYDGAAVLGKWGNVIYGFEYEEDGVIKASDCYLNGFGLVRDKTNLAVQTGICGVMIFRALCDMPFSYEYSLHRAVGSTVADMIV